MKIEEAFLMAVTSAAGEDLCALPMNEPCLRWGPGGSGLTLWPNVAFLPKVLPRGHRNQPIYVARFEPPASRECSKGVRMLVAYIDATAAIRQTDQLFVCYGARPGVVPFLDSVSVDFGHHLLCL